ncbi:diguanylate cyclase (GGDEF) domain-containing protein [Aeromonas sp. RU39B]|uniref:GGDEF domain-containing protein n=1 Tax=Aeromonas sp. RU39B TaxID=1907416 RepID=UPI0009546377|nr:GGDEF domain-containing protein [Aeromonas sp. RU39B]SIQ44216.1 diguanylate cyclase (GGDEF) domain-containing protein [Aeromonas sp. RU39B]
MRSLLRVFRHELDLVEGRLSQLGHEPDKEHKSDRLSAWFVDKSLIELEQIEREYLTHRKALRLDPLTGIFNRRAFDDDLALRAAAGKVYTLVMIDVDHFKALNDNFGHPFGDLVLRRIADVLVCVFGLDHAYRIGGDEFAIILDAPRSEVANRLQQLAVRMQRQLWREGDCQVTLSMGAATGSGAAAPLIKQADAALYQSKHAGRNRWQFA